MKGIVLAGGEGTRLYPATDTISKQLLPVYDKPMVYYPISILMLAEIKEILIISSPNHINLYQDLLGDGSRFGINLNYKIQEKPSGLAEAFILGEKFIGKEDVCLVLGDNIFYYEGLTALLKNSVKNVKISKKAYIFGYYVNDPHRYGVCQFDKTGNVLSIEEKPIYPKSNHAVIGLYFYPNDVVSISKKVKPSVRGELEITSVNESFLLQNRLKVELLGRGFTWLDTGTHESLLEASSFIQTIEKRQGLKVACLEEIAYNKGFISKKKLLKSIEKYKNSPYSIYLKKIYER
jgi:glucose-1-phosphate thymidylyltransferase